MVDKLQSNNNNCIVIIALMLKRSRQLVLQRFFKIKSFVMLAVLRRNV